MIIVLLFLAIIITYICFIYIKNVFLRAILSLIFGITAIFSALLMISNANHHYMMHPQERVTINKKIKPTYISNGKNIMLYQKIGTDSKYTVQTYRDYNDPHRIQHTSVDKYTINKVKFTSCKEATMKTITMTWHYRKWGDFWFGVANWKFNHDRANITMIKRVNTFYIPKTWHVLSEEQFKE